MSVSMTPSTASKWPVLTLPQSVVPVVYAPAPSGDADMLFVESACSVYVHGGPGGASIGVNESGLGASTCVMVPASSPPAAIASNKARWARMCPLYAYATRVQSPSGG